MRHSQYTFFLLMATASGLSILKTGVLAAVLSHDSFAIYAGLAASVSFVAEIISFGRTQGTFKKYPRYVAFCRYSDLKDDIAITCRHLLFRHIVFAVVSAIVAGFFYGGYGVIAAISVSCLAVGMNAFYLVGSLFRALGRLFELGLSTLLRTLVAAACGIGFAFLSGWTGSFLSESISSMVIGLCLVAGLYVHVRKRAAAQANDGVLDQTVSKRLDGVFLFVAFFILSLPVSLDRLLLNRLSDTATASTYAFVGIWLTAAYTLGGIYVQKFGPDIIMQLTHNPGSLPLNRTRKQALLLSALLGIGTAVSMSMLYFLFYDVFWQKYGLTAGIVAVSALAVGLQVTPLFDWTLIALDGEKFILGGAIIFSVVTLGLFLVMFWMGTGFIGYALAMVSGRFFQIVWSDRAVAHLQRKRIPTLAEVTA